jgi:hypothetical protein
MTDLISSETDRFLTEKAQETARRGRLIFALDATASRQPTWDTACKLQAEMFREVAGIGSLDVQLVYYRGPEGHPEGECRASRWYDHPAYLTRAMSSIVCRAGHTQIKRIRLTVAKRLSGRRSAPSFSSVMLARNRRMLLLNPPPILGASGYRFSCFRKVTTGRSSTCSAISRN